MNLVRISTELFSERVRVPHPRFLKVGLRGPMDLGLRQTEQS
jgi:hypothetical protein